MHEIDIYQASISILHTFDKNESKSKLVKAYELRRKFYSNSIILHCELPTPPPFFSFTSPHPIPTPHSHLPPTHTASSKYHIVLPSPPIPSSSSYPTPGLQSQKKKKSEQLRAHVFISYRSKKLATHPIPTRTSKVLHQKKG